MSHDPSGSLWNASQRRWLPGLCSQWNTRVAGAVDLARQARPMVSAMEKPPQVMIPTGTSHESSSIFHDSRCWHRCPCGACHSRECAVGPLGR
jgi:hypothetical protein